MLQKKFNSVKNKKKSGIYVQTLVEEESTIHFLSVFQLKKRAKVKLWLVFNVVRSYNSICKLYLNVSCHRK